MGRDFRHPGQRPEDQAAALDTDPAEWQRVDVDAQADLRFSRFAGDGGRGGLRRRVEDRSERSRAAGQLEDRTVRRRDRRYRRNVGLGRNNSHLRESKRPWERRAAGQPPGMASTYRGIDLRADGNRLLTAGSNRRRLNAVQWRWRSVACPNSTNFSEGTALHGAIIADAYHYGAGEALSGEQLSEILAGAGVGLAQVDTSGQYVVVNDVYCRMVGRTREEVLTLGMQDITHPDDLPSSVDGFIRVLETGTPRIISFRYLQAEGSSPPIRHMALPVKEEDGTPTSVLVLAHAGTGDPASEQAASERRLDLRILIDSAADGFCCVDRSGRTTLANAAFVRMLGYEREEDLLGREIHEVIRHARPGSAPYRRNASPIFKAAESGTPTHVVDEIVFRPDDSHFPAEYWVRPILREGQISGAVLTIVDITQRKAAEARQDLLNRELSHRVKNTLAMVQAIVGQTLRTTPNTQHALRAIGGRLSALSEAHSVLLRTRWGNASVTDVVESAVEPHRSHPDRIRVNGPRVDLGSKAALSLTLALHELCTNAVKYGALSNDTGKVDIRWSISGGAADARFHLTWKEIGGPPVEPPTRMGFGSRLVSEQLGTDFGGETKLQFRPDGVRWKLSGGLASMRA